MPIRINLLAESQAEEESRRRDPVKRAIWVGALLVLLMLVWSSSLQLKAIIARTELNKIEGQLSSRTNEYGQVLDNQKKLAAVNQKLQALQTLAASRLLHGTILNALEQPYVEGVQLVRLKTDLDYALIEEVKAKTNANGRITPGRPASVTEKIVLTLEAKDSSIVPGDQVGKFKQVVSEVPYFQAMLGKTNEVRLTKLEPPQDAPDGKKFVLFTLECRYPEKNR